MKGNKMIEVIETVVVIPSNKEDRKKIKDVLEEISEHMHAISVKRDIIKENIKVLVENHKIPTKLANRMAKCYFKDNFKKESAINDVFNELYSAVVEHKE